MSHRPPRARPLVESLEARSLLSRAGTLDPTFGHGQGNAAVLLADDSIPTDLTGLAVAIQADGKIVTAGVGPTSNSGATTFLVTRYDALGTLDAGFGTGGAVVIPFNKLAAASALAIQADGKIVVGGTLEVALAPFTSPRQFDYAAARLKVDGTLDTDFGTGGTVVLAMGGPVIGSPFDPTETRLKSVLVQADGKIVLAGDAMNAASTGTDFAAARLTTSGALDPTWGGTGIVLAPVQVSGYEGDIAAGAAIQAGGKLVLAGEAFSPGGNSPVTGSSYRGSPYAAALRFNADGTLDPTFGGPTLPGVSLPYGRSYGTMTSKEVRTMALQPDGKIVLGLADDGGSAIRLGADGLLDVGFGAGGEATAFPFGNTRAVLGLAIEPDGGLVLSATASMQDPLSGLMLYRLTAGGQADRTFGSASTPGVGAPLLPGRGAKLDALAIDAAGRIVIASLATTDTTDPATGRASSHDALIVSRVLSRSTVSKPAVSQVPATLDGFGNSNLAVYLPSLGTFAYRPTTGAADVITPFGAPGAGQTIPASADYDGVGHAEIAAYLTAQGFYAIRHADLGYDTFIQFGTPGPGQSIPVPADYEGSGRADIAVYLVGPGAFAIRPADGSAGRIIPFGTAGPGRSIPAPADYYGTGRADVAVYLAEAGAFAIQDPTGQTAGKIVPFGMPGLGHSIPVPGDYDGSGHVELAVYVPSAGAFFYRPFAGGPDVRVAFGIPGAGELPVVADYDASGRSEFAVYDPTLAFFAYRPANGAGDVITAFGSPGAGRSIPVATPAGALAAFSSSGGSGEGSAHAFSLATTPGASGASGVATRSTALPGGPSLASRRIALRPVGLLQARPGDRIV